MNKHDNNDIEYWENYYSKRKDPFEPSLFAKHIKKYVVPGKSIIELGCGNGRDAVYLSESGLNMTAVDQCTKEVNYLSNRYKAKNISFITGDFTTLESTQKYDYIYSRFTLHSIDESGEMSVYNWVENNIVTGGYFFLEVRGRNNDLYGLGEKVVGEDHAFIYDDHYRRFLSIEKITDTLISKGFEITTVVEERGFSPYNGTDEKFIRLIGKKQ